MSYISFCSKNMNILYNYNPLIYDGVTWFTEQRKINKKYQEYRIFDQKYKQRKIDQKYIKKKIENNGHKLYRKTKNGISNIFLYSLYVLSWFSLILIFSTPSFSILFFCPILLYSFFFYIPRHICYSNIINTYPVNPNQTLIYVIVQQVQL